MSNKIIPVTLKDGTGKDIREYEITEFSPLPDGCIIYLTGKRMVETANKYAKPRDLQMQLDRFTTVYTVIRPIRELMTGVVENHSSSASNGSRRI